LLYTLSGQPMQYSKKHRKVTEEKINAVRKLYQNTDDVIEFALNNYKRISLG
jgi:predicted RNase H-like nuclease